MRKSLILRISLTLLVAGVAWGISAARTAPREIVLVADGMAFYLEGDDTPNPTLRLQPGELVRLTLVNRDRGMEHDVALVGLAAGTGIVPGDGSSETIRFRAPTQPGEYDYICRLHIQTMRGRLEIAW